jgi:membrane associated rhomboid family serine protease/Zn-finger nucleic acid-binding protein
MISKPRQAMIERAGRVKMSCPNCGTDLVPAGTEKGIIHACPRCQGSAVPVTVLRRILGAPFVRDLWCRAKVIQEGRGKNCPACSRAMCDVVCKSTQNEVHLDVCTRCQVVWFDDRELAAFPEPQAPPEKQLSLEASEAVALAQLELDKKRHDAKLFGDDESPNEQWKWIPAFFGMPVEIENPPVLSGAWVTWGLTAFLIFIFALTWSNLQQCIQALGMVPADCWRLGGLTFFTSFCLHGGIGHLLGNMYFLFVFGDNVEDDIGHMKYVVLIALSALVGAAAHIALDPRSNVPCIGSSGGISGILAYYALRFPRARLGMIWRIPYSAVFRWSYFPAIFAMFGWILLQIVIALYQAAGQGQVSGMAHLGGAAVGAAAWFLGRIWPKEEAADTP